MDLLHEDAESFGDAQTRSERRSTPHMNPAIVAALSTLLVAYSQPSIAGDKRMRHSSASQPVACDPDSDRQCSPGNDKSMTSSVANITPMLQGLRFFLYSSLGVPDVSPLQA